LIRVPTDRHGRSDWAQREPARVQACLQTGRFSKLPDRNGFEL
jgi:hypothetical protein